MKSLLGTNDYYLVSFPRKESFSRLAKIAACLVIFMLGLVAGLWAATGAGGGRRQHYTSYNGVIFPRAGEAYAGDCGGDDVSFAEFVAPTHLMHAMTDEQLYWRASVVPASRAYPFERVPKVAFLFIAGRGELPLAPLWERFFSGHEGLFSVYVHAPPGRALNVSEHSPFYGREIPSRETSWGSITLMDAEKRLLANALLDFTNERFVLLSESCIPVHDFPTAYNYLTGSRHSFVQVYYKNTLQCRGRYSRYMAPHIKLRQWRKGSQWFELSRELAVSILADRKYYPLYRKYCRPTCYPDEHYVQTFVDMFHGAQNSNRTVTYVDWSTAGPHPAMYSAGSVTADFIQRIRKSEAPCMYNDRPTSTCFLFARKFSPDTLAPLLNMSSTVMGY